MSIIIQGDEMYLHLPGKDFKPTRFIVRIDRENRKLHVWRDPVKHYFRIAQGFGIAYEALTAEAVDIHSVVFHIGDEEYEIEKHRLLRLGRVMEFEGNRLEKQLIISFRALRGEEPDEEVSTEEPTLPTPPEPPAPTARDAQLDFDFGGEE